MTGKLILQKFLCYKKAEKRNERGQHITNTELSLVNSVKGYLLHGKHALSLCLFLYMKGNLSLNFLPFLYHCVEAQHILCGGLTPMVRRLNTNYLGGLQLRNQSVICKVVRAIIVFYYDKIIGDAQVMHLLFIVYSKFYTALTLQCLCFV